MNEHDRERLESLAALVGCGAATPQEGRELNAFLEAHPDAVADACAFADAGAMLADDLDDVPPPANALAGIRTAISKATEEDDSPQHAGAQIIAMADRRKKIYMATTMVAAAAAIAFAVLWSGERTRRQISEHSAEAIAAEVSALRQKVATANVQLASYDVQLEAMRKRLGVAASPELRLVSMAMEHDRGHAKILIDPNGRRWLVVAHALPDIPSDKDFQMWIIPKGDGAAPVSMGVLKKGPMGDFEVALEVPTGMEPAAAAISLEKKGGVDVPTDVKMVGPI